MITREVTLCGKQVTLAYCYATEIAYKDFTGEDIIKYIRYAIECIQSKEDRTSNSPSLPLSPHDCIRSRARTLKKHL